MLSCPLHTAHWHIHFQFMFRRSHAAPAYRYENWPDKSKLIFTFHFVFGDYVRRDNIWIGCVLALHSAYAHRIDYNHLWMNAVFCSRFVFQQINANDDNVHRAHQMYVTHCHWIGIRQQLQERTGKECRMSITNASFEVDENTLWTSWHNWQILRSMLMWAAEKNEYYSLNAYCKIQRHVTLGYAVGYSSFSVLSVSARPCVLIVPKSRLHSLRDDWLSDLDTNDGQCNAFLLRCFCNKRITS